MTEPGPPPATDPDQEVSTPPTGTPIESRIGWTLPPPGPPTRGRRVVAWVATFVVLVFSGVIAYRTADGSDSYRLGRGVGAAIAPLLFVFVIAVIVALVRHRPWRDAYRSAWLPLGTLMLLALGIVSSVSQATAPPAPADPASALRIAPPWTLDLDESATLAQIEGRLKVDQSVRSETARHVAGPGGASAFLVVTDSALRSDVSVDKLAEGLAEGSGGTATIMTVGDQRIVLIQGDNVGLASWVESPLLITVYAADVESARTIASAVLEGG